MMKSARYMKCVLFLILSLIFLFSGCLSKLEENTTKSPEYMDKIEIEITLQPSSNLEYLCKNDITYTVTNNGDKIVNEVLGEITFYKQDVTEIGCMPRMFVSTDKKWESIAIEELKAMWHPIFPGETIKVDWEFIAFFVGYKELKHKLKANWDNLTAEAIIKHVIIE